MQENNDIYAFAAIGKIEKMTAGHIIKPKSSIWTPHRAARRRSLHRPRLCSTTFGGSTVPPLFGGGGGAPPAGNIFVRSVGAIYDSSVDGQGQQNLAMPGSVNIDDDLFVLLNSNASTNSPVNAGDWTNLFTVTFNRFELFTRKADGTAADNFTIAAHTALQVGVMASLSNTVDVTDSILAFQGGFINSDTDDTWNVDGITANTSQDPDAAVMVFCGRNTATVVASPAVNNTLPVTDIMNYGVSQSGEGSLWTYWGFDYQNPSIAYGLTTQGYSPTQGALQWTQYQRFGLF